MKKCKIYCNAKNAEADAVIVDRRILVSAPRREDIEPAHTVDGQYYYPPYYAVDFAKDMNFDLMPFSTECEWGEYGDVDSPVRNRAQYWGDDDYDVKWGYCDVKTGEIRIPPEMEYCDNFNEYGAAVVKTGGMYGIIDTSGDIKDGAYVDIKKSHHGVFFVYESGDGWGAVDSEDNQLIEPMGSGTFEWDGIGGLTRIYEQRDGTEAYGIDNFRDYFGSGILGLTEKPMFYDFPDDKKRENYPWRNYYHSERFRLTKRGNKYGLICDVLENPDNPLSTYTEWVLHPAHDYEDIPDAAYSAWKEMEVDYYAHVMARTPRYVKGRIGDGWDGVPHDIRDAVQEYMTAKGMVQPETIENL
jgi:hypothetical protein